MKKSNLLKNLQKFKYFLRQKIQGYFLHALSHGQADLVVHKKKPIST